MNIEQSVKLLNTIKSYQGKKIRITYYKKNYGYQLINNDWKIVFGGYEKITEEVTLCEVNNFMSILVNNNGTKKNYPFFGMDCIIESLGSINDDNSVSLIYENIFLKNHNLSIENNQLGQEIKREMFQSEDIDEQIKDYIKKEKLSKSPNNPILNDLFDKPSIFDYGTRDRIFPFTNEMLNLYMPMYSFEGKKVLGNLGGGDFALNAYLLGARSVDTFDINEYSYYYYELKKALIKYYSYDEFLSIIENPKKIYANFNDYKHLLKKDVSEIIAKMFEKYNSCLIGLAKKLFLPSAFNAEEREFSSKDLKNLRMTAQFRNFYLSSEENYNLMRNQLLNDVDYQSQFLLGDVTKLQFSTKYDIVYLSNIGDVFDAQQYYAFIRFLQDSVLTDNGQIIIVDKAKKFDFLLNDESVSKVEYNADQITQYNANNMGLSSIPDSEKTVCLYSVYRQPELKHNSKR